MATRSTSLGTSQAIDLEQTLRLLQREGALSQQQVAQIEASVNPEDDRHPFIRIADLGLRTSGESPEPLSLETITRIVAQGCDLPYFRIDPLKIDVEAVTSLVSQAYATRFGSCHSSSPMAK